MFFLSALTCHLRYAVMILCFIVVMILFSKWTGKCSPSNDTQRARSAQNEERRKGVALASDLVTRVKTITDTCYAAHLRWSYDQGHAQDNEKIEQLMHLAYALSYLDTVQMLATTNADIADLLHTEDVPTLVASIQQLQNQIHASVTSRAFSG